LFIVSKEKEGQVSLPCHQPAGVVALLALYSTINSG
jgi:hypothetical protein